MDMVAKGWSWKKLEVGYTRMASTKNPSMTDGHCGSLSLTCTMGGGRRRKYRVPGEERQQIKGVQPTNRSFLPLSFPDSPK